MSERNQARIGDFATYASYILIALFFVMPLIWLLGLSFRTSSEILSGEPRLIPRDPTINNYVRVLFDGDRFVRYLVNGLKLSLSGAFGSMILAAPAAYAFSRFRWRGRGQMLIGVLLFQMISPLVIMVPLYRQMDQLGLTESHLGAAIIYVAVAAPLFTWMLKGFFDGIPKSLEEAAMIDGCSRFQAFLRISLPLSLPGLTSAFILNAIMGWSQFIVPFILLSKPALHPISVGIFNFQGVNDATSTELVAAASILAMLPAIAIFAMLQRFIVGALTAGAVKG